MDTDLVLARRAALAGAAVALRYFASLGALPRETKPDGSVVTEADRATEAAIRAVLVRARPGDAILGEEAGQIGQASRRWIIDPIDGTALFVAGDDRWLVLLALEDAGEITTGVAVVPAQGRIWWAQRGGGAFEGTFAGLDLTGQRRIRVDHSRPGGLPGSRLGVVPTDDGLVPAERKMLAPLTALTLATRWRVHPALLVASGHLDLAVEARGHVWDYAATSLIVEEAGGRFSSLEGITKVVPGPALYSSGPAVHTAALQLLVPPT